MSPRSLAAGFLAGIFLAGGTAAIADETDQANLETPAPVPGPRSWIVGVTGSLERGQEIHWQNGSVTYRAPIELLNYRCRAAHRHHKAAARACERVAYARSIGFDNVQQALAGERTSDEDVAP